MWRPSVIGDTQWQGEDAAFHRLTRETLIHDTIDGQQAQISLEAAIDCLNGCNWNFPNNLVIILRAIGGDLYPSTPFAACGRNVRLVPSRDRMRVVVSTLSLFCDQSGVKADQTDPAILATLGDPTPTKRWLAASLKKTLELQLHL
jgi:hypothetical protein